MNGVLVDDDLRTKLDEVCDETEICDKSGRVLGIYCPVAKSQKHWSAWVKRHYTEADERELDRICREEGEKTTDELLKAISAL